MPPATLHGVGIITKLYLTLTLTLNFLNRLAAIGAECMNTVNRRQKSCAIAKMTAQCALYMGALKIFGTP